MKKIIVLTVHIVFFLLTIYGCFDTAWSYDFPFRSGEKMTFEVTWSHIRAGEAVIELLPIALYNNRDAFHFLFTAKTSEFVDIFYRVRDRIESYADVDMSHSLFYSRSHEGKSVKDTTVEFDWEKNQVQYRRLGENKKREPLPVPEGTFDPLSVFFAFRINNLDLRKEITIPVTDGKKVALGKVNVIKKEIISVKGVKYDTFLVEPELGDIGGVFEKSRDAKLQIWVTADDRCIPVRIKSKVVVGSFVADLIYYSDGSASEKDSH
jgi:hypothetical protein